MATIGHALSSTETTDASGFCADLVVPGTWSIIGVHAQEQTGVAEVVKVGRDANRHYHVRCYDRANDGTLVVLANTQVDVAYLVTRP